MLNKVELIGRVGADPERRFMPNGGAVVNFSLATTRQWKDKNSGERVEKTEWHRVVSYGKLAEIINDYVKKGRLIRVEGRIETQEYEKDGIKRYSTRIVADEMLMLGSRAEAQGNSGASVAPAPVSGQQANQSAPPAEFYDDNPF